METCLAVQKQVIRGHYDLSTLFYRLLWGPHIHHGFWEADESPLVAQVQLTQRLAARARIAGGERVLDVGCGMGGSSIYLARTTVAGSPGSRSARCNVAGPASRRGGMACSGAPSFAAPMQKRSPWQRRRSTSFGASSARNTCSTSRASLPMPRPGSSPGGGLRFVPGWPVTSWIATTSGSRCRTCAKDSSAHRWAVGGITWPGWKQPDSTVETVEDWTSRVVRTWEICQRRVRRSGVRWLARLIDGDTVMFLDRFETILAAYRSGAMQYGCFVAVGTTPPKGPTDWNNRRRPTVGSGSGDRSTTTGDSEVSELM